MGAGVNGGGSGRAGRLLRLLLLLVLALAAVEYLFGSILDASPLRTYLYTPAVNTTHSTVRNSEKLQYWRKKISINTVSQTPANQKINNISNFRKYSTSNNSTTSNNTNSISTNSTKIYTNFSPNNTMGASINKDSSTSSTLMISKITESIKNFETTERTNYELNENYLPLCDDLPSDLGQFPTNTTDLELEDVERKYPEVHKGGRYSPPNCTARHRVAIIVPYRDRKQHLAVFLNHMHPFLMKQQIEYGIYIIEQSGNQDFNRAKLMNVGFMESQRITGRRNQCFIFHDIDLLPLDSRNMYSCPRQPRHMSASIDKFYFRLPYDQLFGGVSAMTEEQFTKVNGFSNKYWGWGGEDDDMASSEGGSERYFNKITLQPAKRSRLVKNVSKFLIGTSKQGRTSRFLPNLARQRGEPKQIRLNKVNYHITRYKMYIARYTMLAHKKTPPNPKRYQLLSQTSKIFQNDGLSTLKYQLVKVTQHHLYTHVLVNIEARS